MTDRRGIARQLDRRDWLILAGLALFAIGLPLILAATSGALTIPHNDDFDFRRSALGLYHDGRVVLTGYSVMSLVGLLVAVQPLLWISGGGAWAFAATTIGFALVAIGAGYLLARRVVGPGRAAVAVLTVVVVPGFIANTTTFMTDVPELATQLGCLALGAAAIGPGGSTRWRWLAASLAVGCFAFSIREVGLAAPVAVLTAVVVADGRIRGRLIVAGVVAAVILAVIHLLTANLPNQGTSVLDLAGGARRLRLAFSTLALILLPAMVLAIAWWRERWRRRDIIAGLLVGLLLAWSALVTIATTGRVPEEMIGNLFTLSGGSGPAGLAGSRPPIYPSPVWTAVQVLALVATILLPGVVAGMFGATIQARGITRRRVRAWVGSTPGILILFAALSAAGLIVYGYGFTMFDRYLWPLAFTLATLLMIRPAGVTTSTDADDAPEAGSRTEAGAGPDRTPRPAMVLVAVMLSGLAVLSVLQLLNANAFSVARWQMAVEATNRGIAAGTIDAGMEWVGFYATGTSDPKQGHLQPGAMSYTRRWPSFHLCAIVSSGPLNRNGYVLLDVQPAAYLQYQVAGEPLPLYLYQIHRTGCP